jgi:hypothetical protein
VTNSPFWGPYNTGFRELITSNPGNFSDLVGVANSMQAVG